MLPQSAILEFFASLGDAERAKVLTKFEKGDANMYVFINTVIVMNHLY